ncbi:unnamed protein product [Soboliphyme baturini]|uniref:FAD_binding_2 domain-containing protein n=1 Tax=Soboliphyme baturini TaxID=241478 RepID=A0A183IW40_9BILA|nr:unnamed protein product [Soboliphyme baturini]
MHIQTQRNVTMLSRVLILCLLYFYGEMAQSKGEAVHVAVVGSGLAGLSAAYYACLRGAHVSLIEGEKRVGGNSAKATSGINGCHTSAQRAMNINDSHELFAADTLKSGHGLSDRQLVNVLVDNSANAVERLTELGANLSDVIILGGHTAPRTHR